MTIGSRDYFRTSFPDRAGEPGMLAMIDRVACTSCRACAAACPAACIYEVEGEGQAESASYHAIDTARCIGCGLCVVLPGPEAEALCPRGAIRMVRNPGAGPASPGLRPHHRGRQGSANPPWARIEEFGALLYLAREVRVRRDSGDSNRAMAWLAEPCWSTGGRPFSVVGDPDREGTALLYRATAEGLDLLERIFEVEWAR